MMASFGLLGAAAGLGKGLIDASGMIAQGISEDRQNAREEARIRLQAKLQGEEAERTRQHGERLADKEMAHRTDLASKGFEQQQALTEMRFGQEKELAGISHANAMALEGARASREDARLRLRAQLELDNAKQLATAESSKWGAEQQAGILKEEFKTLSGLESDIRKRISEGGYMGEDDMGGKAFVPFTQAQMDAARQELNVIESRRRQIDQRLGALTGSQPLYQLETSTLDSYVGAIEPGSEEAGLKLLQERLNPAELAYVQRKLSERQPAEQPAPEQSVVTPAIQAPEQAPAAPQASTQPQPVETASTEQPGEIWPGIRQMADQIRGLAPGQAEQLLADAPGLMQDIIATAEGRPPVIGTTGDRRSFQSRIIEWRRKYAGVARSAPPDIQQKLRAQGWIE